MGRKAIHVFPVEKLEAWNARLEEYKIHPRNHQRLRVHTYSSLAREEGMQPQILRYAVVAYRSKLRRAQKEQIPVSYSKRKILREIKRQFDKKQGSIHQETVI